MAAQTERGIPLSALCPKFLHTNSTSHTWPFSAVAELIDNAYDPDVKARQFWIDKTRVKDQNCLIFMDNGAGMDYDKMHKMLSFGFSDKQTINGHVPVGLYGNGFKSGSMRLGKDAIVFSKKGDTMCVGMLSQTYLQNTGAENVVVPIVMFRSVGGALCLMPEHEACLQDILHHSLFQTKDELFSELKAIHSPSSSSSTGTRIIIWNLRKTSSGTLEFDFDGDRYDIRIPAEVYENTKEQNKRLDSGMQSVPDSVCSLRAYCSILYLRPRMQIIIRGQKVKTQLVSKSLAHILKNTYKPFFLNKPIPITFGYNTKSKEHYGIMLYHKNRLIKAYERVGCQLKANHTGVGVIGVIECDFLQPTHNKQDFDSTDEYRKTLYNVGIKLEEYWKEVRHRLKSTEPIEDIVKRPDQNWVQCDSCLKWRKLPDGIDTDKLPESWFCHMNYDPQFRSCTVEQESEDSDDEQLKYQNTYKQHERNKKKQEEISRQRIEQAKRNAELEKKKAEQQKIAALTKKNAELMRKQQDLESRLRLCAPSTGQQVPPRSPAQATPGSLVNASAGSRPSNNMPVISEVISLSTTTPTRIKRGLVVDRRPGEAKKRRIMNDICSNMPDSPSTSTASPKSCSSPAMIISDDHNGKEAALNNDCDDDSDLMILESSSTPRPTLASFDLSKVKSERRSSQDVSEVHVECNDEVDSLTAMETLDFSTSFPVEQVSITTQTEQRLAVKTEDKNSGGKTDEERENDKQGLPPVERRTDQEQETAGSTQGPPSDQVRNVTWSEKVNGEAHESESNCSAAEQNLVRSDGEADNGETSMGWKKSVPLTDTLLDPLDGKDLSLLEAQQQQDNLLELLDAASKERDESRAQAQLLTSQVKELQSSLLEFTQMMVKKEQCQQSTQTDAEDDEGRQQVLYPQATENTQQLQCKLDNMKKEGEENDLQAVVQKNKEEEQKEGKGSAAGLSVFKIVDDDLACQIDHLLRELDGKNKEQEELKNKLEGLEHQKNKLSACCDKLQKELEEIKRQNEEVKVSVEERGAQTEFPNPQPEQIEANSAGPSNLGRVSASGANLDETQGGPEGEGGKRKPGCSATLRELRRKVGRLLVTFVPALDLEQVNYDCEVIDEILDQVIDEIFCTKEAS